MPRIHRPVDVLAVVGTCEAERSHYARRLAAASGRMPITAQRLAVRSPVAEALALAPWGGPRTGTLCEFPSRMPPAEILAGFAHDAGSGIQRLSGIVCVVDALHVLEDLTRDDYLTRTLATPTGPVTEHLAHAMLTVLQIEFASTIALQNWTALPSRELTTLLGLLTALAPTAEVRLAAPEDDHIWAHPSAGARPADTTAPTQPGWTALLNDDRTPGLRDPRVTTLHYEQIRPFHPGRLEHLLDHRIEPGEFGTVLRSAGLARLATRVDTVGQWQHVGQMFSLEPIAQDPLDPSSTTGTVEPGGSDGISGRDSVDESEPGEEVLAWGQDLAFIGIDMDAPALATALDEATLSDAELACDAAQWRSYPDPFPSWEAA